MKKCSLLALIALSLNVVTANAVTVAKSTNPQLDKYLGKWYEIARLPDRHEKSCNPPIVSEYRINSLNNQQLVINNKCKNKNGHAQLKTTVADFSNDYEILRLKVYFWPDFLKWLPFAYDSNRLYPLDNQQVVIVGSENHQHLWILARRENINMDVLEDAINRAQKNGYVTHKLIFNYRLSYYSRNPKN